MSQAEAETPEATQGPEYENWHIAKIPVSRMTHDNTVNPRDPSDHWARQRLGRYKRGLLGLFVISHRPAQEADQELGQEARPEQWVILDGGNRARLVSMAGDENYEQECQVFEGLTIAQEARVALEYNDRRQWLGIRKWQALVATGDPVAIAIKGMAEKNGWRITTEGGDGTIRGIRDFYALLETAAKLEVHRTKARKGTEAYKAALVSGEQDGLRVLETAFEIFTSAFPDKPGSYAPMIMRGIGLVLLRDGTNVNMERLAIRIRELSEGTSSLIADGRAQGKTLHLGTADGVAMLLVRFYNQGYAINAKARLADQWVKLS